MNKIKPIRLEIKKDIEKITKIIKQDEENKKLYNELYIELKLKYDSFIEDEKEIEERKKEIKEEIEKGEYSLGLLLIRLKKMYEWVE